MPRRGCRLAIRHGRITALLDLRDQLVLHAEHNVGVQIFVALDEDVGDERLITLCVDEEVLMRRAGEVLTRLELIEHAWDVAYEIRSNIVDVYIRRLRRKLDEPFGTSSLETVRGVGYRLREDQ